MLMRLKEKEFLIDESVSELSELGYVSVSPLGWKEILQQFTVVHMKASPAKN